MQRDRVTLGAGIEIRKDGDNMKPFSKLRGRMAEMDIHNYALAEFLGVSTAYLSTRMTHRYSWTIDEVYKIMDFLQIPLEEIFIYFPKGGGIKPQKENPRISKIA